MSYSKYIRFVKVKSSKFAEYSPIFKEWLLANDGKGNTVNVEVDDKGNYKLKSTRRPYPVIEDDSYHLYFIDDFKVIYAKGIPYDCYGEDYISDIKFSADPTVSSIEKSGHTLVLPAYSSKYDIAVLENEIAGLKEELNKLRAGGQITSDDLAKVLQDSKDYTDSSVTKLKEYTDSSLGNIKDYMDSSLEKVYTYINTQDNKIYGNASDTSVNFTMYGLKALINEISGGLIANWNDGEE